MPIGTIWELGLGDEVIATIRETGYEYPWTHGEMADTAKFDHYRTYFRPDEEWPDTPEFEAFLFEINRKRHFWLRNTSNSERFNGVYLLNHDGGTHVWFRLPR